MSTLFKMKGFSGFGNSPIKQVTGAHGTEATEHWKQYKASKITDGGVTEATTKKAVVEGGKKGLKKTAKEVVSKVGKKALKVGGRLLGGAGIVSSLYGMYKSGKEHSGGKAGSKEGQEKWRKTKEKSRSDIWGKGKKGKKVKSIWDK